MSASARWRSSSASGSATPPWRVARSCAAVGEGAVGDQQSLRLRLDQVARGQLDGFAGADQQDRGLAQPGKAVSSPSAPQSTPPTPDWHRCGWRCRRAWRWRRPAGTGGRVARPARRHHARPPGPASPDPGSRFAQHQRVQAGGDPEQVATRHRRRGAGQVMCRSWPGVRMVASQSPARGRRRHARYSSVRLQVDSSTASCTCGSLRKRCQQRRPAHPGRTPPSRAGQPARSGG